MQRLVLIAGITLVLAAPAFAQSHPQSTTVTQTITPTATTTTTTTTTVIDTDVVEPVRSTSVRRRHVHQGPQGQGVVATTDDPPLVYLSMDALIVEPARTPSTLIVTTY